MYTFTEEHNLYDWISMLLFDKVYFGPYPNELMTSRLLTNGFTMVIDLTEDSELLERVDIPTFSYLEYNHQNCHQNHPIIRIKYPITDRSHPQDPFDYCKFISFLYFKVLENRRIYIGCKGGHSRSGMISISLISLLFSCDINSALSYVTESHNLRVNLRPVWRLKKSSINYNQFLFLKKIHKNIYLDIWDVSRNFYKWLLPPEKYLDLIKKNELTLEHQREIVEYFSEKFSKNQYLLNRLKMTYMRKIIIVDRPEEISIDFHNILSGIRLML